MKVFVLLPAHLDVEQWRRDFAAGLVPDETPYGYHNARDFGCEVDFSAPTRPGRGPLSIPRKLLTRLFATDLVHVARNLGQISSGRYDAIWTHTEREHVGLTVLRQLLWWIRLPLTISQSVWIMDRWKQMSSLRRAYLGWILRRTDVLTFHSPANAELARASHLNKRISVVEFGVSAESFPVAPPSEAAPRRPIRVFAPGNDVHRDWPTFAEALGDDDRFDVLIGSRFFPKELLRSNFRLKVLSQAEVREAYAWADVVVIPLKENSHASGLSVLLECVRLGKRVAATDIGGLSHYFPDQPGLFYPIGSPTALRHHLLRTDGAEIAAQVRAAQAHALARDYTTRGYAERHVKLSRELLLERGATAAGGGAN